MMITTRIRWGEIKSGAVLLQRGDVRRKQKKKRVGNARSEKKKGLRKKETPARKQNGEQVEKC